MSQYTVTLKNGIVEYRERKYELTGVQLDFFYELLLEKQADLSKPETLSQASTYKRKWVTDMIAEVKISASNPK